MDRLTYFHPHENHIFLVAILSANSLDETAQINQITHHDHLV